MTSLPRELGDFVLEKLIGQGGMGEVYYGYQKSLDRPVAVKLLREEYARDESFIIRFKREAKSAAKLIHPNIIQVYQLGEVNGEYYFAMEFVEGRDLQQILKENKGRLSKKDSVRIIYEVAKALEVAGSFGIVHRDIKPSNILITKENAVKVMDFGLAKAFQDSSTEVTMSGAVMGTANYMSPEQAEGRDVDQRTDIYSLGVMFYQLLTGYLPFSGENPTSLAFQHVHAKPVPPMEKAQNISQPLNDICVKCLAKKKEDRYQTAKELLVDLQAITVDENSNLASSHIEGSMGETLMNASAEATVASSEVSEVERTYIPNMSLSTKMETNSHTQPAPGTILKTAVEPIEKTEIQKDSPQILEAQTAIRSQPISPSKRLSLKLAIVVLVVLGVSIFSLMNPTTENAPRTIHEMPIAGHTSSADSEGVLIKKSTEAPDSANTNDSQQPTPQTNTATNTVENTETVENTDNNSKKEMVQISLVDLKARLAKGFKIRLGILDAQNQPQNLDEINSLFRLPGTQEIELTHDFYHLLIKKIKIKEDGKLPLEDLPVPIVNHEKVIQQIDNFFVVSRMEELQKMRDYGFNNLDLELINDRIRILETESSARKLANENTRSSIVKAYNLISAESVLSLEGNKLKETLLETAKKDTNIKLTSKGMEEIKETRIVNSLGMAFEIIEPNEFYMGSEDDPMNPKRLVKLTKPFAIGCYEVTNQEFRMIFPEHVSISFLDQNMNGDSQPVVNVDWNKAKKFCEKLSQKEGKVYRLPTEAEWEYCARAGVTTNFSWGKNASDYHKNANLMDKGVPDSVSKGKEPFPLADGYIVTAPVGSFPPNAFKLFDMDGNVSEWVNDYFSDATALKNEKTHIDPKGPVSGNKKCVRGANYKTDMKSSAITYRQGRFEDEKLNDIGFRIVLEIENTNQK